MKKIYLSLLSALVGFSLHAQLTQSNHAPVASYTFQTYRCDSLNINPGASGANASWNFASIVTHSNIVSNFNTTPVTDPAYPSATIAVAASANNTSYYSSTGTELDYFGGNLSVSQGGQTVAAALMYTSAAVVAVYPMSLNTTTTSTIGGNINVTAPFPTSGTFVGNCKVVADGSGTLTLPGTNATFTNVLRVVTSQTINVTALASGTLYQVTYDYYAVGIRNPIFTISTSTANVPSFGAASTQTLVTRDKNVTATTPTVTPPVGVGFQETVATAVNVNVYPNPSSSYVQFATESPDAKLVSIYDITGKLIDKQNFTEGKIKLDVSGLNTGLYIYTVSGSNNRVLKTGKVTVNH